VPAGLLQELDLAIVLVSSEIGHVLQAIIHGWMNPLLISFMNQKNALQDLLSYKLLFKKR
jgi:hypothetical protein